MIINVDTAPTYVKKTCKSSTNGFPYFVYTLENEFLPNNEVNNRYYRSIIQNASTQSVLSIAPSKSMPFDEFLINYIDEEVRVTNIIEGTMINLFYIDGWEIATRNSMGGNYHYFRTQYDGITANESQPTFKQMFLEAIGYADLNDLPNLDKSICYSFVLQHPLNHIVLNIDKPRAVLVSAYKLTNHDSCKCNVEFIDVNTYKSFYNVPTEEFSGILDSGFERYKNNDNEVGFMITHMKTGMRTTMYSSKYMELKLLRGNNPNLHYQYLVLRKVNKVQDFLHYFPQYSEHFKEFKRHFELYSTRLHKLYLDVHVLKVMSLDKITDKRDKYHVEKMHYQVFIPMVKQYIANGKTGMKPKITRSKVMEYLDNANVFVPF